MPNIENINKAIAIMQRAKNLDMTSFQANNYGEEVDYNNVCENEKSLHACGNTACFAGYVAISPEFKAAGGTVDSFGSPVYEEYEDDNAIAKWLDIDSVYASLLVYGRYPFGGGGFYPVPFDEVKPEHVIEKLEQLKESV